MRDKKKKIFSWLFVSVALALFLAPSGSFAATTISITDVAAQFHSIFGKEPTTQELDYWKSRREDKKDLTALRGAMLTAKAKNQTMGDINTAKGIASSVPAAFKSVFGRAPNKAEKAWWADRASCGNFKKYNDMLVSMKYHKAQKVTMGTGGKAQFCAPKTASSGGVSLNKGLGLGTNKSGPIVKIGIWLTKQSIQVTATGKFVFQYPGGKKTFNGGEIVKVSLSGSKYVVSGPGLKKTIEATPKFVPASGSVMQIANYEDEGSSGTNYNTFRGNILIHKDSAGRGMWAINELHSEDYVKGLGETSDNAPKEFQKALAVAARTYVLNHMVLGGRQPKNGFDITNTPNDQWYRGYNYEKKMPDFTNSVSTTVGQVITYNKKLIAALYFSGSDGRTRSAKEVWYTSKFPYLQSKNDPYGGTTLRGHGVGLSGDGAVNYARKEKWDYKKILNYYYTGVKIEKGY